MIKTTPEEMTNQIIRCERLDGCESEVHLYGKFWISNNDISKFDNEFKKLINKYRI